MPSAVGMTKARDKIAAGTLMTGDTLWGFEKV